MKLLARYSELPYMKPGRLADLLAAIQTMAIHERYRRSSADWAHLISGDANRATYWKTVFDEHPEFFRPSPQHPDEYALVWRRASSRYRREIGRVLEQEEIDKPDAQNRSQHLSRPPVPEAQIRTLLDTAINLHQKAVEERRDRRLWIASLTAIVSTIGSFVGALVGVLHAKG